MCVQCLEKIQAQKLPWQMKPGLIATVEDCEGQQVCRVFPMGSISANEIATRICAMAIACRGAGTAALCPDAICGAADAISSTVGTQAAPALWAQKAKANRLTYVNWQIQQELPHLIKIQDTHGLEPVIDRVCEIVKSFGMQPHPDVRAADLRASFAREFQQMRETYEASTGAQPGDDQPQQFGLPSILQQLGRSVN